MPIGSGGHFPISEEALLAVGDPSYGHNSGSGVDMAKLTPNSRIPVARDPLPRKTALCGFIRQMAFAASLA